MNRMQERYQKEAVPALQKAFQFRNVMQVPRITKVVLISAWAANRKCQGSRSPMADMTTITGQNQS